MPVTSFKLLPVLHLLGAFEFVRQSCTSSTLPPHKSKTIPKPATLILTEIGKRTLKLRNLIYIAAAAIALCACSERGAEKKMHKQQIMHLDMRADSLKAYAEPYSGEMPEATTLATNNIGRYDEVFNDSNIYHWNAAEKIGITPLTNLRSHWQLKNPIVKVHSCEDFYIEPLTHSAPFLVKEAALRLHEIGRRFRDSLQARGGGDYRIRVTSLTRTAANVRSLRRHNRNAIDSSVHKLATTFDISYNTFSPMSPKITRTDAQMKALLAEVLLAMRQEGKILVKYEKKQPCFHITAIR